MSQHKITFTKANLEFQKNEVAKAKAKGNDSFVHKGMLHSVSRAERLIQRFESAFKKQPYLNEVTIPYED